MRNFLFASAAMAVLAAAGAASAGDDTTNNQLNRATSQISQININNVGVAVNAEVSPASVGNTVSLLTNATSTIDAQRAASFSSVQVNQNTLQEATANVRDMGTSGSLTISAQSIGNAASFESENGKLGAKTWQAGAGAAALYGMGQNRAGDLFTAYGVRPERTDKLGEGVSFQLNDSTTQVATVNLNNAGIGANVDVSATAVGSTATFEAGQNASALSYQMNTNTQQLATLNVRDIGGQSPVFGTTAIGNNGSWTSGYGAADGINFQTNTQALQRAVTNVSFSGFGGSFSAAATAAGNVANIGARIGN